MSPPSTEGGGGVWHPLGQPSLFLHAFKCADRPRRCPFAGDPVTRAASAGASLFLPYGEVDRVVQHLFGTCGYIFALSTRSALSTFRDSPLDLPRIELCGNDGLEQFIAKLGLSSSLGFSPGPEMA